VLRAAITAGVAGVFAFLSASAHAHLMVAQKGTLNFSGDGAYLLLSLPVSALVRVDDDGDGLLSARELQAHTADIERQVRAAVQLLRGGRALPLQGLLLNLSPPDHPAGHAAAHPGSHTGSNTATHTADAAARQLVVMGRFALAADAVPAAGSVYRFRIGLFGRAAAERRIDMVFTQREASVRQAARQQSARFTPARSERVLFPDTAPR
jgi:hypothetical protein